MWMMSLTVGPTVSQVWGGIASSMVCIKVCCSPSMGMYGITEKTNATAGNTAMKKLYATLSARAANAPLASLAE